MLRGGGGVWWSEVGDRRCFTTLREKWSLSETGDGLKRAKRKLWMGRKGANILLNDKEIGKY